MALSNAGFSFDPAGGSGGRMGRGAPSNAGPQGGPQQATDILSLRVPKRPAFRGIAPQELLLANGGNMAGLQEVIRRLAGLGFGPGAAGASGMGAAGATPRIIPGIDGKGTGPIRGPFDIPQEQIDAMRDRPLDSNTGRTMGNGGIAGNYWGGQRPQPLPIDGTGSVPQSPTFDQSGAIGQYLRDPSVANDWARTFDAPPLYF